MEIHGQALAPFRHAAFSKIHGQALTVVRKWGQTCVVLSSVICNPVVQIAVLKQPVYCAQFPAVFQG
jgi:hypothetical protein